IEAMACGTPVLAFRNGAVPEVVDQGITGCIVDSMEEAVRTLPRVLELDRAAVRRKYEERFTAARMAHDYVRVYERLVGASKIRPERVRPLPRTSVNGGARAS